MISFTLRSIILSVLAILLFAAGWFAHGSFSHRQERTAIRLVRSGDFRFTSPLLDVELPEGIDIRQEPIRFKHEIEQYVQQQIDAKRVAAVSVYVRDLLDGPWFGINENERFNPASMMKVPVMIAWLKRAEKDPRALKRVFVFKGGEDLTAIQDIKPRRTIVAGQRYTVDELLHYMMNYSDNNATSLLFNALSAQEINDVLDNMDVRNETVNGENSISTRGFSGFFRILYNAAYLNREMSEKALQLLSLEDFPQGIAAGVPKGTVVAAKFGELNQGVNGEDKQLHEFGIVYHPQSPYILGIMTRGHDAAIQAELIRTISAKVYAAFSAGPKK
ncbi:MAG TPA: serine hydrolase [Geobacteraceae bacterium]